MYSVNQGFVVLDENYDIVDWFDTEDEAYEFIEEQEEQETKKLSN